MATITIHISGKVGRRKFGCNRGFGICDFSIDVEIEFSFHRMVLALNTEKETSSLNFLTIVPGSSCSNNIFYIDEDVKLPQKAANALGFESVQLHRGEYKFNTFCSQFGTVEDIQTSFQGKLEVFEGGCLKQDN